MKQTLAVPGRRRGPVAAAVIAALAVPALAAGQSPTRAGAISLRDQLRGLMPPAAKVPRAPAVLSVTDCSDDEGAGTLRAVVAAAGEGDTIDLGQLTCATITLAQGAIPVLLDDLTIEGPGVGTLRIDGAGAGRVFVHPGGGTLTLRGLAVANGAVRVEGLHVTGGGCIASAGYVVLDHAAVSDCSATAEGVYGGGIFAAGLAMYTSTLARSTAFGDVPDTGTASFGGGAYAGTLTLVDSTLSGNRAAHAAGRSGYDIGGGAFSNLGGRIAGSTIEGNYSYGIGGGLATFGGTVGIVDSTISGNVARTRSGGGIDLRLFENASIASSTIAGNEAATGGGVYLRGVPQAFALQSTLISGNAAAAGADFGAAMPVTIGGANNLVVSAAPVVALPAGTLNADPRLQPLADNGGSTRTRALSPGSPALDAGNNVAGLLYDQRGSGFPRVLGSAPDIGAFEGARAAPGPSVVPAISPPGLIALALAVLAGVRLRLRRIRRPRRGAFTPLSPDCEHSSHT